MDDHGVEGVPRPTQEEVEIAAALRAALDGNRLSVGDEIDRIAALGMVTVQGYATGRPVDGDELARVFSGERAWGPVAIG